MNFSRPHDQLAYINTGSSSGLQKEHNAFKSENVKKSSTTYQISKKTRYLGKLFSRGLIRMATHEGFIYEFEYFYLKTQIGRHAREKWKSISLFQTLIYRRVNYIHNISVIKTTVNSFS